MACGNREQSEEFITGPTGQIRAGTGHTEQHDRIPGCLQVGVQYLFRKVGVQNFRHRIRNIRVVIELENKESGKKFTNYFNVDVGINEIENKEAFEFLYPGTYELAVRVERRYRSGRIFSGSRKVTRGEVTLVQ